ncbi:SH3 domain-containing protein [Microbaculum marinum]|uniref:SH3 domain-containing protein n=1 Tax=Microbaculum marinum TaxID=1764581 RepID=A0AAW9RV36_9HYPH
MTGTSLSRRFILTAVAALVAAAVPPWADNAAGQSAPAVRTGPSGLPLPRFVSLKSDRINVRAGPGEDHRVSWIFAKAGLPVEIIAEYDNWRRIRDSEGAEGWVFHSLLSGRRTALVAPWSEEKTLDMFRNPDRDERVAARLEPGVLVNLEKCDGSWCRVTVSDVNGWMPQDQLWGVYPKEIVN